MYDIRRRLAGKGKNKQQHIIYDEEGDVSDALEDAGYKLASHDPYEKGINFHWVSCGDLYEAYTRFMRAKRWNGRTELLTAVKFGIALRAVNEGPLTRSKLWVLDGKGKRVRVNSYQGIKGPKSFFRRPRVGRPRNDD